MKTITKSVILLVLATVMCFAFVACKGNSSDDGTNDIIGKEGETGGSIVGKWTDESDIYEFTDDGEYTVTDYEDGDMYEWGTYEISGDKLVLIDGESDTGWKTNNTYQIEGDKLTIIYYSKSADRDITYEYTRVK